MVYVGTYDCYENIKKKFSIKKISIKTMTLSKFLTTKRKWL